VGAAGAGGAGDHRLRAVKGGAGQGPPRPYAPV
jgi:hypothetical protein